jgi:branched-chain amino acid transport system permease protein
MTAVARMGAGPPAWLAALAIAAAFPAFAGSNYYISTGITALMFVTLAVAFDLVVGRIGALSLAQPLFFGFGAYTAGILSANHSTNFWLELAIVCAGAFALAVLIGIPSFRLSLHSFAIGTLGFALIGELVAKNWVEVTRGPLCVTGIDQLTLPLIGATFTATTLTQQYYVILGIAAITVTAILILTRLRLGMAFSAVRDDPLLASARGLWPTQFRLVAFGLSAAFSGAAGAFAAHFQAVVCPNSVSIAYTTALLIMVFIGGRGSLRGVVIAAIAFTAIPQLLRITDEWRLVIYGAILLVVVTSFPDGLEQLFRTVSKQRRRLMRSAPEGGGAR